MRAAITLKMAVLRGADWDKQSISKRVCTVKGPHPHYFFGLGHRKRVRLIELPRTYGYVPWLGCIRDQKMYLGEDGVIYRRGRSKIYVAEIEKRQSYRDIDDVRWGVGQIVSTAPVA
jgi:hypothetical protein